MKYICHRVNHASALDSIPNQYGVEIDLRDGLDGRIYMEHDPFVPGEDFEEYLMNYDLNGIMILNIKSERIEEKVLQLIQKYSVKEYFFLDSSFPMIFLMTQKGEDQFAIRFSEYEGMDTIRKMSGRAKWVWADCFTKLILNDKNFRELKDLGYQICLVSPELQGRPQDISEYAKQLKEQHIIPDAICTKQAYIDQWKQYFE